MAPPWLRLVAVGVALIVIPVGLYLFLYQRTRIENATIRYWLAAHKLYESHQRDNGATEALWNHLHCLIDTHRRFSQPDETVRVTG